MASANAKDPLRKRAQFLNRIQQPVWWSGRVVHKALENWVLPEVKAGRWPDSSQVIALAQGLARQQFLFSQSGQYHTIDQNEAGEAYYVLAPHFFGETPKPELLEKTLEDVGKALLHLLNSQLMKEFLLGRQWYRWELKNLQFGVNGKTVRAVPDLLMPSKSGPGLEVLDWKVAERASRYEFQVAVYALAARETAWLDVYARAGVTGYVINLLEPEPAVALNTPYEIGEEVLAATLDEIYESIANIHSLIGDRKYDQLDMGMFEYAKSVGTCALCNWRELCVELSDGTPAKSLSNFESKPTQLEFPFD